MKNLFSFRFRESLFSEEIMPIFYNVSNNFVPEIPHGLDPPTIIDRFPVIPVK